MSNKKILDACCGSRMFWFDKNHPNAIFADIREEKEILCDGRKLEVHPDVISDFTNMIFEDSSFKLVVFDPPHLSSGKNSWLYKKYGVLPKNWKEVFTKAFAECFRVLKMMAYWYLNGMKNKCQSKTYLSLLNISHYSVIRLDEVEKQNG